MADRDANKSETPAPQPAAQGETVAVVLQADELADLDAWIATRTHKLSRPEALRELALAKARVDLDGGD